MPKMAWAESGGNEYREICIHSVYILHYAEMLRCTGAGGLCSVHTYVRTYVSSSDCSTEMETAASLQNDTRANRQ